MNIFLSSVSDIGEILKLFDSMFGISSEIDKYVSEAMKTVSAAVFLFAAVSCFFGYKLFKFWIAVTGFFAFGALGAAIGLAATDGDGGAAVVFFLIFAILGAFLAFKLYKVGVFILCAAMGFILGYILSQEMALAAILALILGVVGVMFVKPVVIISTGVSGGILAGNSLAIVMGTKNPTGLVLGIVLVVLGIWVQYHMDKKKAQPMPVGAESTVNPPLPPNTQHGTSPDPISEKSDPISASTSAAVSTIKSTAKGFTENIKTKIESENESVLKKAKGLNFDEICENIEEILHANKIIKNVMPFALYVVYFFVAATALEILTNTYINYLLVPVVFCIFCIAKKQYIPVAVFLSVSVLKNIMMLKNYFGGYYYSSPLLHIMANLAVTAILVYAAYLVIAKIIKVRNEAKAAVEPSATTKVTDRVICGSCGTTNDSGAKFCKHCGKPISAEQISLDTTQETKEPTEDNPPTE